MVDKTYNICGFKCKLNDNIYIFPRSKLEKKYWKYVDFIKIKNRYYCDIYILFKNIYSKSYLKYIKTDHSFYKGLQKFIKTTSEKYKYKLLKISLYNLLNKLISYSKNFNYTNDKKWDNLKCNWYYCDKNDISIIKHSEVYINYHTGNYGLTNGTNYDIKILEYINDKIIYNIDNKIDKIFDKKIKKDIYLIQYYEYNKINNTFIKISKIKQEFKYEMINKRYILYSNRKHTIKSKIICLSCNNHAFNVDYYRTHIKECNKCDNGWNCGRNCIRTIGVVKGYMLKCINCENTFFNDIITNGTFENFEIKKYLLELHNQKRKSYISNFDKLDKKLTIIDKLICIKKREYNKNYYNLQFDIINNILIKKIMMLNTKMIYKRYKDKYLIDVFLENPNYIKWLITHMWELDTNKKYDSYGYYSRKVIKKTQKVESNFTKIFRYILGIPKYPCDKFDCKKYAMYGIDNNKPFRCYIHKFSSHKIVIQTECRGVNGICPYGCKKGNIKYDNFCIYCFTHLFPNDKRIKNIRSKSKEIKIVNHICLTHVGIWYHDKPLYVNYINLCCPSKRRIDLRQLINNTMLCIEIDENQHKYYTTCDDFIRYNELLYEFTCKYIFIRFNPDKYKKKNKIYNPHINDRLDILDNEIIKQIDRIKQNKNTNLLELIHLYYDEK